MIMGNTNSNCADARLFYHDFLDSETKGYIPQSSRKHINECRHCQDKIRQLEALLTHTDKADEYIQQSQATIALLRLHFNYINRPVTCNVAKLFLPSLAIQPLEISIPTPITVHLDKCQDCADDLSTVRNLGLTQEQLYRLGQLLGDKPPEDTINCSQARPFISSVASMLFDKTSSEILKHLCICPNCRNLLYQNRETVLTKLSLHEKPHKDGICEAFSEADIYNYCIPYGIDPANNRHANLHESFASHLRNCPTCLNKMQRLHTTIYTIAERPDSEIVTRFTLKGQTEEIVESKLDDLYSHWPIKVQMLDKPKPAPAISIEPTEIPRTLKQRISPLNLKQFIKPMAAAAIILIGILLLFNVPSVKAVDLSQIHEALEKIKNIHISRSLPDEVRPWQRK